MLMGNRLVLLLLVQLLKFIYRMVNIVFLLKVTMLLDLPLGVRAQKRWMFLLEQSQLL